MVVTSNFPCTCILVLVRNRLYVLFDPSIAQWYMDAWPFGFMAKWIHGSLDSWHNGCMAAWIHGTMDEYSLDSWHNRCIAVCIHGTMDMWQFGCMVFSKTSTPPPPAVVQNQNTLFMLKPIYNKNPK